MTGRMTVEMEEQPAVLELLLHRRAAIAAIVREVSPRPLLGVELLAHGSSRNAALFGRHVLESATRRPAALGALSRGDGDPADVDRNGHLAVAVSQSGRTTDVVAALRQAREQGARTLAVVNEADSPLAGAADAVIDLRAGVEAAVPATKTHTATLLALAICAEALSSRPLWEANALLLVPDTVAAVVADDLPVRHLAVRLDPVRHLLVTARGALLAAAFETALKIRETTGILAEAIAAEEARHGWLAGLGPGHALLDFSTPAAAAATASIAAEVRARGALALVAAARPDADLPLPLSVSGPLLALPAAVRGQQLAAFLAARRGLDADAPAGLSKVTLSA